MNILYLHNSLIFSYNSKLFFINSFGIIRFELPLNLKDVTFYFSHSHLIVGYELNTAYSKSIEAILNKITKILDSLKVEFISKIVLFGVGFKSWICKVKDGSRYIVLKVGLSRDICIKVPFVIKVIVLKPTLILFKSLDKNILKQYVSFIRSLKMPDAYKGKGLRYVGEKFSLKIGKA